MRIGILGTGSLATALATGWSRAGHHITVGGRSPDKATALADTVGGHVRPVPDVAADADAVLLAVSWSGVPDMLRAAGPLDGVPLIDPTNAVDHGVGVLHASPAEHIAATVPGAHVVKAFHLFPSGVWTDPRDSTVTVVMCGDDQRALSVVGTLVTDVGGAPVVLGGLARARQLEEVAGFVIGLAFSGVDPRSAVPSAP
ncbi:NADPH-dependent F420 reductase [Cryptosporangium arvum]|uniref:NADPH-dependent F420 reductase n=1 Tax=Cryptosporangium arvum TaxID=80871 RepID=UPI0004B2DDAF|nr:NAD(P)-binding domain-containing protein [Cryptosporangium arvum]